MECNLRIVKLFDLTGLESTEFADLASICSNYLSALGDSATSDGAPIAKKVVNMWENAMKVTGPYHSNPEESQEGVVDKGPTDDEWRELEEPPL